MDENEWSETFKLYLYKISKHSKGAINYRCNFLLLNSKPYDKYIAAPRNISICFHSRKPKKVSVVLVAGAVADFEAMTTVSCMWKKPSDGFDLLSLTELPLL